MSNTNSTVVNIPHDLSDLEALKRTITRVVEEIDKLKGFRGGVAIEEKLEALTEKVNLIEETLQSIQDSNEETTLFRNLGINNVNLPTT